LITQSQFLGEKAQVVNYNKTPAPSPFIPTPKPTPNSCGGVGQRCCDFYGIKTCNSGASCQIGNCYLNQPVRCGSIGQRCCDFFGYKSCKRGGVCGSSGACVDGTP
jgi:hypothetical protein